LPKPAPENATAGLCGDLVGCLRGFHAREFSLAAVVTGELLAPSKSS
jgi:hypothetical protein